MTPSLLKKLANLLVIVGVGICATFGSQLTPQTMAEISESIRIRSQDTHVAQHTKKSKIEAPVDRLVIWGDRARIPFGAGLILIIAGSLLGRKARREELRYQMSLGSHVEDEAKHVLIDAHDTLSGMLHILDKIRSDLSRVQEADEALLNEVKGHLERLQHEQLDPLIEYRDVLKATWGTEQFINVFDPVARAERKINRAWCACVDQHALELNISIEAAYAAVHEASGHVPK